jgi:anaerobic magnesium-protoporphyrin IX monomethyl ester cyclase
VSSIGRRPVVLYQPRDQGMAMPLGLLALGSWLNDEHVVIVDGRFEVAPEARVVELAPHAALLGVSVRSGAPLRDAARVSAAARAANPRLTVLWGGPHATLFPESCLSLAPAGVVDGCVRGAGEEAFAATLETVRSGRSLEGLPGLLTPGSGPVESRRAPAPDRQPRAHYSLLDVERHFEAAGRRRLDYCSSRGTRASRDWSGLGMERVLAELAELAERHGLSEVVFRDEDFHGEPRRVDALAEGLAELGGHLGWCATVRVDDVLEGGHDRLELLVRGRCRKLLLPITEAMAAEAGQRERTLDAARLLHAAGLPARFEITLADPGPGAANLKAAIALARALCALDPHFETPVRRSAALRPAVPAPESLEAWAARWDAPWDDVRAERRLARIAFYFAEAQRFPGRRIGKHLLRLVSLLRVRLGFFGLELDRLAVEVCAVIRTGRSRPLPHGD